MSDFDSAGSGRGRALDLVVEVDLEFLVVAVSPDALEYLDASSGPVVGQSLANFVHPDDLERGLGAFSSVVAFEGVRPAGAYRVRIGATRHEAFDVTGERVVEPADRVVLRLTPIGERRRSEILAMGQLELLEAAAAGADLDACMQRLVVLCESFAPGTAAVVHRIDRGQLRPIAGSLLSRAIVERFGDELDWRSQPSFLTAHERSISYVEHDLSTQDHWNYLRPALDAGGWLSCVTSPIQDSAGRPLGFMEVLRQDDTRPENEELTFFALLARVAGTLLANRQSEELLTRAANEDPVTGLDNRRAMGEAMDDLIGQDRSFGVLLIDLNRFRWIYSNFGHSAGDRILRIAGERICSGTDSQAMTFRYTGDAFVVVVPDVDGVESLVEFARSVLATLDDPVADGNVAHALTASVGIARFIAGRDRAAEDVLSRAEAAMYTAKRDGGNAVRVYSTSTANRTQKRIELASSFLAGLDDGQFRLVYQPVFSIGESTIAGVEALVRWDHPRLGVVSPDEFVPIAEQAGFCLDLDRWVLTENSRHHQALRAEGYCDSAFQSWVNLSPQTLEHPGMNETFDDLTLIFDERVGVEITEREGFRNLAGAAATVAQLRERGFDVAIDDYGTGQASLTYLADFDVTALKLDKSFIARLGDQRLREIVEHTVSLGHRLGLKLTAEGIETAAQYDDCDRLGFDSAQGFLMSKPLSPAQLRDELKSSRSSMESWATGGRASNREGQWMSAGLATTTPHD